MRLRSPECSRQLSMAHKVTLYLPPTALATLPDQAASARSRSRGKSHNRSQSSTSGPSSPSQETRTLRVRNVTTVTHLHFRPSVAPSSGRHGPDRHANPLGHRRYTPPIRPINNRNRSAANVGRSVTTRRPPMSLGIGQFSLEPFHSRRLVAFDSNR